MKRAAAPIAILCSVGLAFAWLSRNPPPAAPARSDAAAKQADCGTFDVCKIEGDFPRQVTSAALKYDFVQIDLTIDSYWSKALLVPTAGDLTRKALVALATQRDKIGRAHSVVVIASVKDSGRTVGLLRATFPTALIAQASSRDQRTIFQLASAAGPLAGPGGAEVRAFCHDDAYARDTGVLCK